MLHASKLLTPSPKPLKPQTLQTSNPSNLKPFKPQTLQTSNSSNPSIPKLFLYCSLPIMGDSIQKAHLMHSKSIHKPYLYKYGLRMALVWFMYGLSMVCHITGEK